MTASTVFTSLNALTLVSEDYLSTQDSDQAPLLLYYQFGCY